jgi:hypothetical protein
VSDAHSWLNVLEHVWGKQHTLTREQADALTAHELPGETALATVARLAGVDVSGVKPFEHSKVRELCALKRWEMGR